jgi:hypothetical protein
MKTLLIILGIFFAVIILLVIITILLAPWMDRWRTTPEERAAIYPGDELLKDPKRIVNRAVTVNAIPAQIYPWIVQMGAVIPGWNDWWVARWQRWKS